MTVGPKVPIGVLGVCAECSPPLVNYLRRRPFEVSTHAMRAALRVSNFILLAKAQAGFRVAGFLTPGFAAEVACRHVCISLLRRRFYANEASFFVF